MDEHNESEEYEGLTDLDDWLDDDPNSCPYCGWDIDAEGFCTSIECGWSIDDEILYDDESEA